MNIKAAIQHLVNDYPGGAAALAKDAGMSEWSLRKKANPNYAGAHFSPCELLLIMQLSGDVRPLQAQADELGQLLVGMPACGVDPDSEGGRGLIATVKALSEFMSESAQAFCDGKISDNELAAIENEGMQAQAAIGKWCRIARRINVAAKPAGMAA